MASAAGVVPWPKKAALRIDNEHYLRSHPELHTLVHGFVCALLEERPDNVHDYARAWFTRDANQPALVPDSRGAPTAGQDEGGPIEAPTAAVPAQAAPGTDKVDEDAELRAQLLEVFREADHDGSGSLDIEEFQELMATAALGLSKGQIADILRRVDANNDGRVDYAEFLPAALEVIRTLRGRSAQEGT